MYLADFQRPNNGQGVLSFFSFRAFPRFHASRCFIFIHAVVQFAFFRGWPAPPYPGQIFFARGSSRASGQRVGKAAQGGIGFTRCQQTRSILVQPVYGGGNKVRGTEAGSETRDYTVRVPGAALRRQARGLVQNKDVRIFMDDGEKKTVFSCSFSHSASAGQMFRACVF